MQFMFSGKNYFDSTWCIIRTSKYLAKKKNYYCKEHKFSLMLTGLFILFIKATTTTFPFVTLPPSPPHSFVDHGQHARHRPELYASLPYYAVMAMWALARSSVSSEPQSKLLQLLLLPYYFTAGYFTHDQYGEWKNSDFRGGISYFTHALYAQNCIKHILLFYNYDFKQKIVFFDTRGQHGVSRTASVKMQQECAAEAARPRSRVSAEFSHGQWANRSCGLTYRTIFFFTKACETRVGSPFTDIENASSLNLTQHLSTRR